MLYGIALTVCGLLCVPSLLAKNEQMKDALKVVSQFQGWIGLIICVYGIWGIIDSILRLSWIGTWPLWWLTYLVAAVI